MFHRLAQTRRAIRRSDLRRSACLRRSEGTCRSRPGAERRHGRLHDVMRLDPRPLTVFKANGRIQSFARDLYAVVRGKAFQGMPGYVSVVFANID